MRCGDGMTVARRSNARRVLLWSSRIGVWVKVYHGSEATSSRLGVAKRFHSLYIGGCPGFQASTKGRQMAVVAYQGLWNSEANSQAGYSFLVNKNPRRNPIKRSMNREGFRYLTALFGGLVGAASGGNVTATHKRIGVTTSSGVAGVQELGALGGLRQVDTITDINRNTTAADVTALKEMVFGVKTAPVTYPKPFGANSNAAQNVINPR